MRSLVSAIVTVLATVGVITVTAATPAEANTSGFRWGAGPVCVHYSGSHPHLAAYAVGEWNALPELVLVLKSSCVGYPERINIADGKSGTAKAAGWTSFTGKYFPTPCASACTGTGWYWGADRADAWGWLLKTPVTVHANTSYRWTINTYKAMLVHELGHALGLTHTARCDSVMSTTCFSRSVPTSYDRAEIARVYP